jgi:hypothetical protein
VAWGNLSYSRRKLLPKGRLERCQSCRAVPSAWASVRIIALSCWAREVSSTTGSDARRRHQPAANLTLAHDLKQLPVKHPELLTQYPAGDQQRFDDRGQFRRVREQHLILKVRLPSCVSVASIGNNRAKAISENEPNYEPDCESDCEVRHHIT